MNTSVVDRIYEAAAIPELWPDVLHDVATKLGFEGGALASSNIQYDRAVASRGLEPLLERYLNEGWSTRYLRCDRAEAMGHAGFVRDQDVVSAHELETDPFYAELLRPLGLGFGAGSYVASPNGDAIFIAFEGALARGPISAGAVRALDGLRGDFARAAMFSARLDLERSQAQVSALAALGLPAVVLGSGRRVLAANEGFQALSAQIRIGAQDLLGLVEPSSDALLSLALSPGERRAGGRSIPLKASGESAPAVLHLLPVRRGARDIFSLASWLVVVTPLGVGAAPVASILSGLFDLSPAEARVAREVIGGRSVADTAAMHGLSEATVRTQLRAVFAKTGTTRQSELVAACLGLTPAKSLGEHGPGVTGDVGALASN